MTTYYWGLDGRHMDHIEHCAVWATCEHDDGYGACRECYEAGHWSYCYSDSDGVWVTDAETLDAALAGAARALGEQ